MILLRCAVCKEQLPTDRYGKSPTKRGYQYTCSRCVKAESVKRLSTVLGRLRNAVHTSRQSAKQRGLDWDLSLEYLNDLYIKQEGKCALSGITMTLGVKLQGSEGVSTTLSIDRIDNKIGYLEGNIQLVTNYANMAKNQYSTEELIHFCECVLKTQKAKK